MLQTLTMIENFTYLNGEIDRVDSKSSSW